MEEVIHYEQMIEQSEAEIEKLHEQLARDREQRKVELKRIERESKARIAKCEAEREKLKKDTRYYPQITLVAAILTAVLSILSHIWWGWCYLGN